VHKVFYASGFIFHPQSQQILLQQTTPEDIALFSGVSKQTESGATTFQRVLKENAGINIPPTLIYPIYSYESNDSKKKIDVFYAVVDEQVSEFPKGKNAAWFNFKKLYKTKLKGDLLQDLTVGQRVINAASRDLYNQELIDKG